MMENFEFSRQEIEDLAGQLDALGTQLTERERILLLAIFSAAGQHVAIHAPPKGSGDTEQTLADLKEQILNAFIPGYDIQEAHPYRIGRMPADRQASQQPSADLSDPPADAASDQP
jgi:hypothetical protein